MIDVLFLQATNPAGAWEPRREERRPATHEEGGGCLALDEGDVLRSLALNTAIHHDALRFPLSNQREGMRCSVRHCGGWRRVARDLSSEP